MILNKKQKQADQIKDYIMEHRQIFDNLLSKMTEILEILTDSEKRVIVSRFGLDGEKKTYAEIAQINKMTEDQVREIEVAALRKLRYPSRFCRMKSIIASDSEDDFWC